MIEGEGFRIKESKFDYFFGRVRSNPKNQARSLQNLRDLNRLGIRESEGGQQRLLELFAVGLSAAEVGRRIRPAFGMTVIRAVEVSSPEARGAIEISYFYPGADLSVIPEVVSIIPKIYRQEA